MKTTLETSGKDVKTTLETSGKDHPTPKRINPLVVKFVKTIRRTMKKWAKSILVSSVIFDLPHSF